MRKGRNSLQTSTGRSTLAEKTDATSHLVIPSNRRHFLPVADFLTRNAIDRRSYAVENDDRALCILQNRLVILIRLFAGLKFEVFARFTSPIDLALTVVIGLNVAFEPPKERPRPLPPRRHSRRHVRPRR